MPNPKWLALALILVVPAGGTSSRGGAEQLANRDDHDTRRDRGRGPLRAPRSLYPRPPGQNRSLDQGPLCPISRAPLSDNSTA